MGNAERITDAAEKISKIFGCAAFSEQTFKVKDVLTDMVPKLTSNKKELDKAIRDIIYDLECIDTSI